MIVRMCPMCDSEMQKAHYCDTCHSWIWKPQMLDVHFNTKTRGMGEPDCAYGEEHDAYHHMMGSDNRYYQNEEKAAKGRTKTTDRRQSGNQAASGTRTSQRAAPQSRNRKETPGQYGEGSRSAKKKTSGIVILVIVIIYIIAGLLSAGILD